MKIRVELKNPKTYNDAMTIAKEKEAKMMKMKELGMFPCADVVSANDVSVNMVEVSKNPIQSVTVKESQRPKQV